jgi:phage/plasmid-associated DNA primase
MSDVKWMNYFVPSIYSYMTEGHLKAEELRQKVEAHNGAEAYHCVYDLEPRETYRDYVGLKRPAFDRVWFDFDSEEDGGVRALNETKAFCQWIGVTDLLITYSGNKGFHVGVPFSYFGLLPSADLDTQLHNLATHLKKTKWPTLDTSVYNANRKFRVLGSLNPKTRRYKMQVPLELVMRSESEDGYKIVIEEIKGQASKVRGSLVYDHPPQYEPLPQIVEALAHVKNKTYTSSEGATDSEYFTQFEKFKGKLCISELLKNRCDEGGRHKTALVIISDLHKTGVHEPDALKTILEWAKRNRMDEGREAELEKMVRGFYSGSLKYSFGCQAPEKAQNCSGKCKIYAKLEPVKRPQVMDAPAKLLQNKKQTLTEHALALVLLERLGDRIIRQNESLFSYDGKKWSEMRTPQINQLKNALNELCDNQLSARATDSAFSTFERMVPTLPEKENLFNANPSCVNFLNGTLHIRQSNDHHYEMDWRPHRRDDFVINVLPYEYDPNSTVKNTEFLNMVDRVFEGDVDAEEKKAALQEMFGSCLVPSWPHFFMLYGKPKTGKSTVIQIAEKLVSPENLCSVEPHQFNGFNMESMVGKLINSDTDITMHKPIADSQIKKVIDRRPFRIRRKKIADAYGLIPGIHIFGGNDIPPTLEGVSKAHDRRWTFLEFCHEQGVGQYDKEYWRYVFNQSPEGLLNYAVEGLKRLCQARGHYTQPSSGSQKMGEWQSLNDPIEQFVKDVEAGEVGSEEVGIKLNSEARSTRPKLYDWFRFWAKESGFRAMPMQRTDFYRGLRQKGYREVKVQGERVFYGFDAKHTPPDAKF